jgi:hypothetical protein
MSLHSYAALACAALGLSAVGCAGTGRAQVFVTAEDTIPLGLQPGSGDDEIVDGWRVEYQKFVIAFGNFRAARSADASAKLTQPAVWAIDLRAIPTDGFVYTSFDNVAAERWDKVGYDLPNATPSIQRAEFTDAADAQRMIDNGWSLYIEATLTKTGGQSCRPDAPTMCTPRERVTLKWGVSAGTSFDDCAPVIGPAGFAVPTGGTVQVKPTIHGDHWFFSNIAQGAEQTVRRAQWIVDCDVDGNGEVTLAELQAARASQLFRAPDYNLSGAVGTIDTAYDFFVAQARTLGDFQGAGECPTRRVLQ